MEPRRLMSITPGWSADVAGVSLSYQITNPEDPSRRGDLIVTGTSGNDVLRLARDPSAEGRLLLDLNGTAFSVDLADLSRSLQSVVLDGGAGDDRLVSEITYDFSEFVFTYTSAESGMVYRQLARWDVQLNGGDGNDALYGGSAMHVFLGGAGDDLLVGGDGRNFMNGGEGNDTLFGHGYALDGHGQDPTYDQLAGGPGYDVVHGGAMGWATADDGNDLVFQGQALEPLRVQALEGGAMPYTAGDPLLAGAAGATAVVVNRVLVITGTGGNDVVALEVDASGKLAVSVNGTTTTFDRGAVDRYVLDARGGQDELLVKSDLAGWVVRTPHASDAVNVRVEVTETSVTRPVPMYATSDVESKTTRYSVLQGKRAARRAARREAAAERRARLSQAAPLSGWVPGLNIFGHKRVARGGDRPADVLGG